jgi:hypothetical protein
MEIPPLHPHLPWHFWAALATALGCGIFTAYLLIGKGPWKGKIGRQVVPLWFFIAAIIAAGTAFFTFWDHLKTGPVRFEAAQMETPYGKVQYEDIRRVYVHRQAEPSMINPELERKAVNWLIIEERSGKKHALSEEQYDLAALEKALQGYLSEENR